MGLSHLVSVTGVVYCLLCPGAMELLGLVAIGQQSPVYVPAWTRVECTKHAEERSFLPSPVYIFIMGHSLWVDMTSRQVY